MRRTRRHCCVGEPLELFHSSSVGTLMSEWLSLVWCQLTSDADVNASIRVFLTQKKKDLQSPYLDTDPKIDVDKWYLHQHLSARLSIRHSVSQQKLMQTSQKRLISVYSTQHRKTSKTHLWSYLNILYRHHNYVALGWKYLSAASNPMYRVCATSSNHTCQNLHPWKQIFDWILAPSSAVFWNEISVHCNLRQQSTCKTFIAFTVMLRDGPPVTKRKASFVVAFFGGGAHAVWILGGAPHYPVRCPNRSHPCWAVLVQPPPPDMPAVFRTSALVMSNNWSQLSQDLQTSAASLMIFPTFPTFERICRLQIWDAIIILCYFP